MEKIMNVWAKITSLSIMLFAIYGIYMSIKSLFSPLPMFSFLFSSISISMLLFYAPLIYYGWAKNPKNEYMKWWARILTIIFPVLAIIGFISPWGLDFPKDILFILPAFALITPLYYYAWRD